MTKQHEGEHEWVPRILGWEDVDGARCSIPFCDAQMDDEEMSRRLNEWETLKKAIEALREYAVHRKGCEVWNQTVRYFHDGERDLCDCGLDALLTEKDK